MIATNLRSCIVRNQVWDSALAQLYPLNLCQLIFRLFSRDTVDSETTLCIIHKAEVLACLFNRDHIHESGRVCCVGAYFAVNLDEALHDDGFGFAGIEGIL